MGIAGAENFAKCHVAKARPIVAEVSIGVVIVEARILKRFFTGTGRDREVRIKEECVGLHLIRIGGIHVVELYDGADEDGSGNRRTLHGPDRTRLRLISCGWGTGDEWDKAEKFFTWGNRVTLERLIARCEKLKQRESRTVQVNTQSDDKDAG